MDVWQMFRIRMLDGINREVTRVKLIEVSEVGALEEKMDRKN